ncbi:Omp28-related outer membrane protein [Fluviicola chungangensis]|uniref:Omp28-related outer membrane protein n=1 Tax=Fluviicola chungangensis TaxID=2597671 RepID=A0A556MZS9_9FLAO|nr:Omp28-related outer membrane protein [Fluviicola chungangensis]TSJ45405.1 Omp28-related outer membrane protein [Fluviicola chungangensis]
MKKTLLAFSAVFVAGTSFSQIIMSEDFEGTTAPAIPATWSQTTLATDGGFKSGTAATLSSQSFPVPTTNATKMLVTNDDGCNCDKSADRLISPTIDLSTAAAAVMEVDLFYAQGTYQGATESGKIEVSIDGGTTWTTAQTLTGSASWQNVGINLTPYVGNANVKVSFLYNDNGGWLFGMGIDNFVVRQPSPDDAKFLSASVNRYSLTSTNNTLSLQVKNDGANAITSLTVDWNDGTAHSSVISTNIAVGATATINHPIAVNYATVVEKTLNINITGVNGNTDPNPGNNTGSKPFNTVSANSQKVVLFEEGTGTWCGWCPRGAVAMEYMDNTYPNTFAGVAVHNGDPMTVTAYDAAADFSGFPGANVDRVLLGVDVSDQDFETYYNDRKDLITPVGIAIQTGGSGNNVTVTVNATFRSNFAAANYRLGVIISEDNVTGTGSTWNQHNYYSSQTNNIALTGAGHNWQTEPDPVLAANMEYDHVGRALLGGYSGQAGSVPAVIADGQVATYTFNYTVPATSVRANMHAVAVVIDQATGEVLNAKEISLATLGLAETSTINMEVFPNPASDVVNVNFEGQGGDYTVSIIDLSGRTVASKVVTGAGATSVAVPVTGLVSGNYLVSIANETGSYTQKLMVK